MEWINIQKLQHERIKKNHKQMKIRFSHSGKY